MNAKHILAVLSSPRKNGNSSLLAEHMLQGAAEAGAETEVVRLSGLEVKPCRGCYSCAKNPRVGCVQRDDMTELYPKIAAAQTLILASPIYFFNMSGPLKTFLDRCMASQYSGGGLKGKGLALAFAFGGEDPYLSGCVNAIRCFQDTCRYTGMVYKGQIYGHADDPGELTGDAALLEQARALGRSLLV